MRHKKDRGRDIKRDREIQHYQGYTWHWRTEPCRQYQCHSIRAKEREKNGSETGEIQKEIGRSNTNKCIPGIGELGHVDDIVSVL